MEPTFRRPEAAVGAIAVQDGSLLLIRRGQPPSAGRWSVPGGRVEWGETLAQAVAREVEEETGLQVDVGDLAGVVERRYLPEFHYVILDYFVSVTGGALRPGGDVTDARWATFADLKELDLAEGLLDSLRDFGVDLGG
ncbi:MAG: NUDIX hydrolase [Actinomycetota bacterium]